MTISIVARLIEYGSGEVIREFDLTDLSRDELDRWWAELLPRMEVGCQYVLLDLRDDLRDAALEAAESEHRSRRVHPPAGTS